MRSLSGVPWDEEKYPVSPEAKAHIMRSFGFDQPPLIHYGLLMWNALPGNFGMPFEDSGETVTQLWKPTLVGSELAAIGGTHRFLLNEKLEIAEFQMYVSAGLGRAMMIGRTRTDGCSGDSR